MVAAGPVRGPGRLRLEVRRGAGDAVKQPGCDVLFLGDSLVKHGLSPRVIGQATGRSAYNLAAPACTAPMTYHLFRRALDAGAKPSTIVFDLKPSLQVGGLEYYVRNLAEVATPAELLDVCRSERFRKSATELIVEWLLTSYRCRRELRGDLLAALAGKTARIRDLNALCERNWTANDGVNITTPRPGYHGEVTEAEHDHMLSRGFFPDRIKTGYACRLLTLAGDRGIRAYLVLPPFVPDLAERRKQTGAERKYEAFVRSLQDRFPALTVLDARDGGYPATVFVDPIHLDAPGHARTQLRRRGRPPRPTSTASTRSGHRSAGSGSRHTASARFRPTWKTSSVRGQD